MGEHGTKYRGKDAKKKAAEQGRATYANGYRGKYNFPQGRGK